MSRATLEHAAELLGRLVPLSTPAPWVDGSVDGNRYGALVHTGCSRDCDSYAARHDELGYHFSHPHDGYGGCLVGESLHAPDRRLLAVLRNVADDLLGLLEAIAHEDPVEVGRLAGRIADAVVATHTPRGEVSP